MSSVGNRPPPSSDAAKGQMNTAVPTQTPVALPVNLEVDPATHVRSAESAQEIAKTAAAQRIKDAYAVQQQSSSGLLQGAGIGEPMPPSVNWTPQVQAGATAFSSNLGRMMDSFTGEAQRAVSTRDSAGLPIHDIQSNDGLIRAAMILNVDADDPTVWQSFMQINSERREGMLAGARKHDLNALEQLEKAEAAAARAEGYAKFMFPIAAILAAVAMIMAPGIGTLAIAAISAAIMITQAVMKMEAGLKMLDAKEEQKRGEMFDTQMQRSDVSGKAMTEALNEIQNAKNATIEAVLECLERQGQNLNKTARLGR